MKVAIVQDNGGKVTIHFLVNNHTLSMEDYGEAEDMLTAMDYRYKGTVRVSQDTKISVFNK